jgi:hypothetical protein
MYYYVYLLASLIIFPAWLILFIIRKSDRRSMISVGLYLRFLVIPLEFLWFRDYWHPLKYLSLPTLLYQETIFYFLLGGIVPVFYNFPQNHNYKFKLINFIIPIVILFVSMLIFTNGLKFNSIYSMDIALIITASMIFYLKPELIKKSVISAFSMLIITIIGYKILLMIFPNLFNDWWVLKNISGIFLLGIPLEEIIWFFLFGLSFAPIYDFWTASS